MNRERNALRTGIFIIVCLAAAIGVIIAIRGTEQLFEPKQHAVISFPLGADVGGLRRGDDLRIGGYKVGVVEGIELADIDAPAKARADVRVTLPEKYILHQDTTALIQTTFTGQSWINIESLGQGPRLSVTDRLNGKPAAFTQMLNELAKMAPEIRGVLSDIRTTSIPRANAAIDEFGKTVATYREVGEQGKQVVSDVQAKIEPISEKARNFLDRGSEMMVELRDLLGDTKLDFRTAVANLRQALGTLKDRLPGLIDQANNVLVKLDNTTDLLDQTLKDTGSIIGDTKATTATIREVIVGNRGKLEGMIASLKTTTDNLKGASTEIRQSPWRLLYKPSSDEQRNFRTINTARQFAQGATELNDAATALRDAANNPATKGEDVQKLLDRLDAQFGKFQQVEAELWKDVKR
jgi:ABC-type transporter Mla subunit MlaD